MVGTGLKIARQAVRVSSVTVLFLVGFLLTSMMGLAQVTTATLTGTVADRDSAVIPGAKVTVINHANKYTRTVNSNGSGVFTFPGLNSGDYSLEISYKGFEGYKVEGVHLNPGDTRDITTIRMVPGATDITVNVDTSGQNVVGDDGARDFIITSADLNKLSLEGREVTELLKILPGSAINNGVNGNSADSNVSYDPGTVQFGGASGSYSMSGSPVNGAAIRSDGANLTDPGTGAGSLQTINAEATAEVKIQTANFGADNANGPMVINAVGKAGASDFHGSVYSYGRTGQLDSTDSIAKLLSPVKPADRFIYPGATFGGPVRIPHTNFNHDKKLVFFVSGEDYIQRNVYAYNSVTAAVNHALVPTLAMRNGNFSAAEIQKYIAPEVAPCDPHNLPPKVNVCPNLLTISDPTFGGTQNYWANLNVVPVSDGAGNPISCTGAPGDCLAGHEDPGVVAQSTLFPLPNTPGGITNGLGYNFTQTNVDDSDIYQVHGRLDYEKGKSKYYVTYTTENGKTNIVQGENYFSSGQNGGIDTPGGTARNTYTGSGSANWSIVFSPTLTNEAFASGLYSDQIDNAGRPGSLFNTAIGYPYGGAYDNNTKEFPNLNTYSSGGGYPIGIFPDYSYGALYNKTFAPGIGDNLTKQLQKHTLKAGVNIERPRINGTLIDTGNSGQPGTNGQIQNYYVGPTFQLPNLTTASGEPYQVYHSTCYQAGDSGCAISNGNSNNVANYFIGEFQEYQQSNIIPHIRMHAWSTSMYATDDWKVFRNFSINLGVRVEHVGRWIDDHGFGSAVFIPSDYAGEYNNLNNPSVPLPGFRWHSIDKSIPISGFALRQFFYEPRVGFNWDVYGTGKTTLAGGWGQYRFRDGQQDAINSVTASNGYRNVSVVGPGPDPNHPNSINQGGLTMPYVQSLHLSTAPGVATSTFFAGGYNQSPNFVTSNQTFYAVNQNDSQVPMTTNYSLTVTQQLPKATTFSVGYVGNHSAYLTNDNGGGPTTANINAVPVGGFFLPDPNPASAYYGLTYSVGALGANTFAPNDYRQYPRYGSIQVETHTLTANYNGLQLTMEHSTGSIYLKANYTWSRNQGEKGGYQNGNAGDSFNVRNNYGPLAYDRTNIANLAYNIDFGAKYHGNHLLQSALNGWSTSGIVNLQSGPNLLAINYSTNFGLGGYITSTIAGQQNYYLGSVPYLGTTDVNLQPLLNCNPTAHLQRRQYVSANCFALPTPGGQNGPFNLPYIHGPAYFQADSTLVKDFHVREKQTLEFRAAAFNFLNYKLKTFTNLAQPALSLTYPLATDTGFGLSQYNSGRRVLEMAIKYTF